jgi:hypothetical protein
MAQYWLQTPIENAKEVVQRYIDDNLVSLPGLTGKLVSYTELTEVIYYSGQIPTDLISSDEIVFGTWYLANVEGVLQCFIDDGIGGSVITFDPSTGSSAENGMYPYIIWNKLGGVPNTPSYFVGYKFKVL